MPNLLSFQNYAIPSNASQAFSKPLWQICLLAQAGLRNVARYSFKFVTDILLKIFSTVGV